MIPIVIIKYQLLFHVPIKTAPRISNIDPRMQAWKRVSTLAPTDVPNELATSLAPIPKARAKETMKPTMTIHNHSDGMSTMLWLWWWWWWWWR